ncbi:MAG: hypothetical protein KJI71_00660 [Patescibacteria group bacterium]|nr:hypothetical protein [Patescibacteria group bacterium]
MIQLPDEAYKIRFTTLIDRVKNIIKIYKGGDCLTSVETMKVDIPAEIFNKYVELCKIANVNPIVKIIEDLECRIGSVEVNEYANGYKELFNF